MEIVTREQIKSKLSNHYHSHIERELVETPSMSNYDRLGAILFALEGSPPKGYALYVPGHYELWFYDAWGKRFQIMKEVTLDGVERHGNT